MLFYRNGLPIKPVAQLALLPWTGEDIGVQNGIIYSSLVSNGEGEQAGMTFPMNPRTDGLREGVIGCMEESWIVYSGLAKIKQYRITRHSVDCALNRDLFMLKAGIAE